MVTYCLGSARQKREYFMDASGVVVLDNVEVLFCASENGRNYFAYGPVPFGNFTVAEYVRYKLGARGAPSAEQIKTFRLDPDKRLKRLSAAQMRIADFLAQTGGRTDKAVVISLDGAKYTRKNAAALKNLLNAADEAYVCITDKRFMRIAANDCKTLSFGKSVKGARPEFYAAKELAKKLGAKRVSVM